MRHLLQAYDKRFDNTRSEGHLKDRGFCTPIIDEAEAAARKKKDELDREIEMIKKEYEEKLKKRKKSKDSKQKRKEKDEVKDDNLGSSKADEDDDKKAEKEKDDKINALVDKGPTTTNEEGPRIFTLQK
ncbi:MAG: hypothetical protein Q9184_006543 [Pyrenodesmia sp. 2 TL-2023]